MTPGRWLIALNVVLAMIAIQSLRIAITMKTGSTADTAVLGLIACIGVFAAANLGYYFHSADRSPSRIGRVIRLWLDAKEAELKKRAKPD